jgi:hypothetical protein
VAAGSVFIPWYATGFRGDGLEEALAEISPIAMRYGATYHGVYRSRDDRYRFTQIATFPDKVDFDRYWYGEEFGRFRAQHSGWYQVPVLYVWNDEIVSGALHPEPAAPNG